MEEEKKEWIGAPAILPLFVKKRTGEEDLCIHAIYITPLLLLDIYSHAQSINNTGLINIHFIT
jgi:hypothetical protein